jgi:hypothetical protein
VRVFRALPRNGSTYHNIRSGIKYLVFIYFHSLKTSYSTKGNSCSSTRHCGYNPPPTTTPTSVPCGERHTALQELCFMSQTPLKNYWNLTLCYAQLVAKTVVSLLNIHFTPIWKHYLRNVNFIKFRCIFRVTADFTVIKSGRHAVEESLYLLTLEYTKLWLWLWFSKGVKFFFPMALQPQFGPWPTSMKLFVSLRFSRS